MRVTACIVLPWFVERYEAGTLWQALAWWIHDHLPYSEMTFFPIYAAINLRWHERRVRRINTVSTASSPRGVSSRNRAWRTTWGITPLSIRVFRS